MRKVTLKVRIDDDITKSIQVDKGWQVHDSIKYIYSKFTDIPHIGRTESKLHNHYPNYQKSILQNFKLKSVFALTNNNSLDREAKVTFCYYLLDLFTCYVFYLFL